MVERGGLLRPHQVPLDFATGEGFALHVALGLLAWGAWSAVCAAAGAVQDAYTGWRWSAHAVRHCSDAADANRLPSWGRRLLGRRVGSLVELVLRLLW